MFEHGLAESHKQTDTHTQIQGWPVATQSEQDEAYASAEFTQNLATWDIIFLIHCFVSLSSFTERLTRPLLFCLPC